MTQNFLLPIDTFNDSNFWKKCSFGSNKTVLSKNYK